MKKANGKSKAKMKSTKTDKKNIKITIQADLKKQAGKVLKQLQTAQKKFEGVLKNKHIVEEARKYAEKQRTEIKKLISSDVDKVKSFIEREKKQLDRLQKQIPGEIKKLTTYVDGHRKEFDKLLGHLKKAGQKKVMKATRAKKKATPKSTSTLGSATDSPETTMTQDTTQIPPPSTP